MRPAPQPWWLAYGGLYLLFAGFLLWDGLQFTGRFYDPLFRLALPGIVSAVVALDLLRRGTVAAASALGAGVVAGLLGLTLGMQPDREFARSLPELFADALVWLSVTVPIAALFVVSRGASLALGLAGAWAIVAVRAALVPGVLGVLASSAAIGLVGLGLVLAAWRAPSALPEPVRRARAPFVGWWLAALVAVVLTVALSGGGLPFWVAAPLLLAVPVFLANPLRPWLVGAAVATLVVGYAPWLPCSVSDSWSSDDPGYVPYAERVPPFAAAQRGVAWNDSGIDSVLTTTCGVAGFAVGAGLFAALLALPLGPFARYSRKALTS